MVGITRSKVIYRQTVFTQKVLRTEVLRTEGFTHIFLHTDALHTDVFTQTQNAHREVLPPFLITYLSCSPSSTVYVYIYIYIVFPLHHDILLYINISFYYYELVVNICCCYL